MTSERWEQIKALFEAACERPPDDRAAWLAESCGADRALQAEVARLLVSDDRADGFLEMPVGVAALSDRGFAAADEILTRDLTQSLEGRHVGAYKILSLLGAGGMGEVYRARDTRLGRDIAIKVLPRVFTTDPERLLRFEREARMLAALNHPHIATIHGVEEADGIRALVLELVDGPTLADRLADGPLPIPEALSIARDIADALDAAHEKGIIHRDLKPANIKIASDGMVKVLDFGIAKMTAGAGTTPDELQRWNVPMGQTNEGMILGTTRYMSPEQARGHQVDKRTDVWAFGCVLYEMLTGRPVFAGPTTSDTIAAILDREPDWHALPVSTPVSARRLLRRCLEKDPKRRLRDIGDAKVEIDEALASPAITAVQAAQPGASAGRRWIIAVSLATVAVAGAFVTGRVTVGPPATTEMQVHRLTDSVGLEEAPAISPDGRSVAFVASTGGSRQIWLRLVAGGAPLQLTRERREHLFPRWAADSSSLIYFSPAREGETEGAIWEISALGGVPRRVLSSLSDADLSHDGKRMAFVRFAGGRLELAVAERDGSGAKAVAQLEAGRDYRTPRWSPDDKLLAFQGLYGNTQDIFIVPVTGGRPRNVTPDADNLGGFTWLPDSSGLVVSHSRGSTMRYLPTFNLWTIRLDDGSFRQIVGGEQSYVHPDINQAGKLVASRMRIQFDVWKYPVDGSGIENVRRGIRLTRQTGQVQTPSVSPDDREAVYLSDSGGHANLWVTTLDTAETRQITYERDPQVIIGVPIWSPRERLIAFFSVRRDAPLRDGYWLVNADGSGLREIAPYGGWATWSPDGRWLYYRGAQPDRHLQKVPVDGGPVVTVRTDKADKPAVGPDGSLYFVVELPSLTGQPDLEVRVARPENGPSQILSRIPVARIAEWQISQPVISPDGKWLALSLTDGMTSNIWAISTSDGMLRQLTDFGDRPTFIARRVSWTSHSRFICAAVGEGDADIVLLEGLRDR